MPLSRLICNYNDFCQDRASTSITSSSSPFPHRYVDLIQGVLSRQGGAACTNSLALLSANTNATTFSTQHNFFDTSTTQQSEHKYNKIPTQNLGKSTKKAGAWQHRSNGSMPAGCQGKQRLALFHTLPATLQ